MNRINRCCRWASDVVIQAVQPVFPAGLSRRGQSGSGNDRDSFRNRAYGESAGSFCAYIDKCFPLSKPVAKQWKGIVSDGAVNDNCAGQIFAVKLTREGPCFLSGDNDLKERFIHHQQQPAPVCMGQRISGKQSADIGL